MMSEILRRHGYFATNNAQARLSVRPAGDGMGRVEPVGFVAHAPARPPILLRRQLRHHPREPGLEPEAAYCTISATVNCSKRCRTLAASSGAYWALAFVMFCGTSWSRHRVDRARIDTRAKAAYGVASLS